MMSRRFVPIDGLSRRNIALMANTLDRQICPCCEGRGCHITQPEDTTITLFGLEIEGAMVSIRPCDDCEGMGVVVGFNAN